MRRGYPRSPLVVLFVIASLTMVLCTSVRARADGACDLRWENGPIPEEWSHAFSDVQALVETLDRQTTDCRSIRVSRSENGATLVFVTTDGRTARRRIADPRELRPTVEALLVSGSDPPTPVSAAAPTPAAIAGAVGDDVPPAADRPSPSPKPRPNDSVALLLGAGAGIKGSFPHDSIAAVGQAFVGVTFAEWELAAFGRLESEHDSDEDNDLGSRPLRYSAAGGGAMFGRREALGPLVLIAGTRAALFAAEQERGGKNDRSTGVRVNDRFLDPRLGLYAGCIFAEVSHVRFRFEIDADAGLVEHRAELADVGAFPRWNLGVSLGAEMGQLP